MVCKRTPPKKPSPGKAPATSTRSQGPAEKEGGLPPTNNKKKNTTLNKQKKPDQNSPNKPVSIRGGGNKPDANKSNHTNGQAEQPEPGSSHRLGQGTRDDTPVHANTICQTLDSTHSTHSAAAPPTVRRQKPTTTNRENLAAKAAAAGLVNAQRVLTAVPDPAGNARRNTRESVRVGDPNNTTGNLPPVAQSALRELQHSLHQRQFANTLADFGDKSKRALDFAPILPRRDYEPRARDLFDTSTQASHTSKATTLQSSTLTKQLHEEDPVHMNTAEFQEMAATPYDSVNQIRQSLYALEDHVDGLGGYLAAPLKEELLHGHQNLVRRATDHCLLRGHLFLAEGKVAQGQALLHIDQELKTRADKLLTKISGLQEPDLEESVQSVTSGRKLTTSPGEQPHKPTKNGFKTAKNVANKPFKQTQMGFQAELVRRSSTKPNLESTRDHGRQAHMEESYLNSGLNSYLKDAARARLNVPPPRVHQRDRWSAAPTRRVSTGGSSPQKQTK